MAAPAKSCCLDPVSTFLLRDCTDVVRPFLVNASLREGNIVTFLLKKVSADLKNYRPMSNLSFVSKLFDRVGGVCPGGKLPHWGGLGRLMARVGWLQQRQKSVGSSLLRSKDRQHGTVCQHRCDHHSQDMTLRAFRHELKSHLFFNTGPSTVDRRRLDCLHGAVYKCHLYAAPCVCVRLNWTELLS